MGGSALAVVVEEDPSEMETLGFEEEEPAGGKSSKLPFSLIILLIPSD